MRRDMSRQFYLSNNNRVQQFLAQIWSTRCKKSSKKHYDQQEAKSMHHSQCFFRFSHIGGATPPGTLHTFGIRSTTPLRCTLSSAPLPSRVLATGLLSCNYVMSLDGKSKHRKIHYLFFYPKEMML